MRDCGNIPIRIINQHEFIRLKGITMKVKSIFRDLVIRWWEDWVYRYFYGILEHLWDDSTKDISINLDAWV